MWNNIKNIFKYYFKTYYTNTFFPKSLNTLWKYYLGWLQSIPEYGFLLSMLEHLLYACFCYHIFYVNNRTITWAENIFISWNKYLETQLQDSINKTNNLWEQDC